MKNTTYMALALLASATFNTTLAGKKKDVVQVATVYHIGKMHVIDQGKWVFGLQVGTDSAVCLVDFYREILYHLAYELIDVSLTEVQYLLRLECGRL